MNNTNVKDELKNVILEKSNSYLKNSNDKNV